ncbi:MAG: hypothetical protein FJZ01_23725 [Candidatus Sericytochromatia bacterium]|nr:hypothetical protein [Candidatus Tanganyikabacteria bacterium]
MNLEEARSVLETNQVLRRSLERAGESLAVFSTIDEARGMALENMQRRLAVLKDNLGIWAALMDAAAAVKQPELREAYDLLLEFHAEQMRRFAAEI